MGKNVKNAEIKERGLTGFLREFFPSFAVLPLTLKRLMRQSGRFLSEMLTLCHYSSTKLSKASL